MPSGGIVVANVYYSIIGCEESDMVDIAHVGAS